MGHREMLPSEIVVLMAMAATGQPVAALPGCPGDESCDRVDYLYKSLIRRGYLKETTSRWYQLTMKGRLAIVKFLHQNETRVGELVEALQKLGIKTGEWIGTI